jgi:hypothetical protein
MEGVAMNSFYATLYQAAPVLLLGVFILASYIFFRTLKPSPANNYGMPMAVATFTGVGGFAAVGASFVLSYQFGLTLADTSFMKFVILSMLFAWQIAEFTGAFWFGYALQTLSVAKTVIAVILFGGGFFVSFVAGQSYISQQVDSIETKRLHESDKYQAALKQRENAANEAASLAVSDSAYQNAQSQYEKLSTELREYKNSQATNSTGANVGTVASVTNRYGCSGYYSTYCEEIRRINSEIYDHQQIMRNYEAYQAALSHSDKLEAKPLPEAATTDATLPGIKNLSVFLGVPVETVKANFNGLIGLGNEFLAVCLLWLFGGFLASMKARTQGDFATIDTAPPSREPTEDKPGFFERIAESAGRGAGEVAAANAKARLVPSTGTPNIGAATIGTPYNIGTPNIGAATIGTPYNIGTPNIGTSKHTVEYRDRERVPPELSQKQGKGRVGKIDTCKDCGKDFEVLTHNGTRCKPCATKAENSYRRAKTKART